MVCTRCLMMRVVRGVDSGSSVTAVCVGERWRWPAKQESELGKRMGSSAMTDSAAW